MRRQSHEALTGWLPKQAAALLDRLALQAPMWLVGGTVLDYLSGLSCREIDAVSGLSAADLRAAKGRPIGGRHDTHSWIKDDIKIEISPLRGDSLLADLELRDFSVTAIALSWPAGNVYDPALGRRDRERRRLRAQAHGNALQDDPLRILRAFRRVAEGYRLDARTAAVIAAQTPKLAEVERERIGAEVLKILRGRFAGRALLALASFPNLLPAIDPGLGLMVRPDAPLGHRYGVWLHTSHLVNALPVDLPLRLAALFHDVGKVLRGQHFEIEGHAQRSAAYADDVCKSWSIERELRFAAINLIRAHTFSPEALLASPADLRAWAAENEHHLPSLLEFKRADRWAAGTGKSDTDIERLREMARAVLQQPYPRRPADLNVDTQQLLESLAVAKRRRSAFLSALWRWVLADPAVRNRPDAIARESQALASRYL